MELHIHVPDWDSSQPPLWSCHCLETLPWDLQCILERRAPIQNGAHQNWHLAGAWETGVFPSPRSSAQGLHPRERFHHSLSAIHKQPPSSLSSPSHTRLLLCPLLHIHIYIFIFHTPSFIILTFGTDFGASSLRLWAMWAPVPSVQYAEVTACLTCHCRRNKGERYDTCPCYTSLCIFNVSAFPSGQRHVSDKSHTTGNKFLTLSGKPAATFQASASFKLPRVRQNFTFNMQ